MIFDDYVRGAMASLLRGVPLNNDGSIASSSYAANLSINAISIAEQTTHRVCASVGHVRLMAFCAPVQEAARDFDDHDRCPRCMCKIDRDGATVKPPTHALERPCKVCGEPETKHAKWCGNREQPPPPPVDMGAPKKRRSA